MAGIIADIEKLNERLEPRDPLGKGTVTISEIRSTHPACVLSPMAARYIWIAD